MTRADKAKKMTERSFKKNKYHNLKIKILEILKKTFSIQIVTLMAAACICTLAIYIYALYWVWDSDYYI